MQTRPRLVLAIIHVKNVPAQFAYPTLAVTGILGIAMAALAEGSAGTLVWLAKRINAVTGMKNLQVPSASAPRYGGRVVN